MAGSNRGKVYQQGIVFLAVLVVLGCQTTESPKHLKLGTLLPITGDLAAYGASMQEGARLLIDRVNACGGVLGQPVELISQDDQTDAAAGAAAMTRLAEVDRVAGVVGAASSAVSSAAVEIAVRNQVVMVSPSSTSPGFSDRARHGDFKGFWLRTAPPDTFQGEALAKLAKARGYHLVSILAINNDYGNGLLTAFTSAFETLGGQITNKANPTRYAPDSSTFDSVVNAAFKGSPDAVLLIAYPDTGSLILKAAYEQGLLGKKTKILVTDGLKETKIATQIGKTSQGTYIATGMLGTAPSAGGPALKNFRELFTSKYKRPPKVYDPNTWDAAALLVLAAEAAKAPIASAIKNKLREVANPPGETVTDVCQALSLIRAGKKVNYQGASGSVDLNPQGDVTGSYDIWTVAQDGEIKVTGKISASGE